MSGAIDVITKPISSVVGAVGGLVGGGGGGGAPAPVPTPAPVVATQPDEAAVLAARKDKLRATAVGTVTGLAGQSNALGRTKSSTATRELLG